MKSIILLGLIWAFNIGDVANKENKSCVDGGSVSISFRVGHGLDCTGWGICYLKLSFSSASGQLGAFPMMGSIKLNNLDNGFELKFSKDELMKNQPDKLGFIDGKSEVTFTQEFQIPNEVREALESKQNLTIKPGTYPLTFIDGIFTIKFPY
jgi:hypothetical protein